MNQKTDSLFTRVCYVTDNNSEYLKTLSKVLNLDSLSTWTYKKTCKWFNPFFEKEYLAYRFYVLRRWILKNESYTPKFIKNLEELISILSLQSELNQKEINYLNSYRSLIFAKTRNIKNIIVDFEVKKDEEVWYFYESDFLFQQINNEWKQIAKQLNLFLTNQRIVFEFDNMCCSLNYKELVSVKLRNKVLEIISKNHTCLRILSFKINIIYVSLERVFKILKIKL